MFDGLVCLVVVPDDGGHGQDALAHPDVALEASDRLATAVLNFLEGVDAN
jgi:hypothetical protein